MGACDFLRKEFTSADFTLVLPSLIGLSDFYFQKVTRTQLVMCKIGIYPLIPALYKHNLYRTLTPC
jgi:hypothetical protein